MSDFVSVCKAAEIPDPGKQIVEVGERLVVVFHVDGQFYVLDDVCTHDGGPLGEGVLEGFTITCPRHGAKFDIRDGRVLCMPATMGTSSHEVKVENGEVYVKLVNRPRKNYVWG
jgi:3-phenylpropionate/trans-cinnamate dioxygenase ferredoxin subunit